MGSNLGCIALLSKLHWNQNSKYHIHPADLYISHPSSRAIHITSIQQSHTYHIHPAGPYISHPSSRAIHITSIQQIYTYHIHPAGPYISHPSSTAISGLSKFSIKDFTATMRLAEKQMTSEDNTENTPVQFLEMAILWLLYQ